jgi:acetyl esterase/lipase
MRLRPTAVIAHYPPVDFLRLDVLLREQGCQAQVSNHDDAKSFESRYLGGPVQQTAALAERANPASSAKAGVPPFLIQNDSADCFVGSAQSPKLVDALRRVGGETTYDLLAGADHGGHPSKPATTFANWSRLLPIRYGRAAAVMKVSSG